MSLPGLGLGVQNRTSFGSAVTLAQIYSEGGFTNMWTSENTTIVSTTTTFIDYAGEHNLANPGASNQPTYNASGSLGSNSKPSFTFDGSSDYVYKAVSGWRSSDSTGEIVVVFRVLNTSTIRVLSSADEASTNYFITDGTNAAGGDVFDFYTFDTGAAEDRRMRGDTDIQTGSPSKLYSYGTGGSSYHIIGNGTSETVTAVTNSDDGGTWFDEITDRDNIAIGALIRSSTQYGNIEFCFAGYRPFTSIANSQSIQALINTYYGIY
jgi:hypothetical protein